MIKNTALSLLLFLSSLAYAGIDSDLNSFFNNIGFASNVGSPGAYQGQQSGYYTGGSIFARTQVRDVQIMQMEVPSFRSGCGGIDLFAGGFSFINADQLVSLFKNIMNNAKSYAFTLAMETATPQLANIMKYLQNVANEVNRMNINSCEAAAGMLGSVWPRNQEVQRRVCEDIGSKRGVFSDYAAAKQGCGLGGELSSTLKNKANDRDKKMIFDEGNIAWKAIRQNGFLQSDTQLAELFMSLSGSIIVRKNHGVREAPPKNTNPSDDDITNSFLPLPSLATNKKLLTALLRGGEATIYRCDENQECLNPQTTSITIQANSSLIAQTRKILDSIAQKIHVNTAVNNSEIGLLQSTGLPVYKMLTVQAAFYKDQNILDVSSYAEIIALDILFQYLSESLNIVRTSSANLQYPEEIMRDFVAGIDTAKLSLRAEQKSAYAQITTTSHLIQQTQMIEQMLSGHFSSNLTQTLAWAKGGH